MPKISILEAEQEPRGGGVVTFDRRFQSAQLRVVIAIGRVQLAITRDDGAPLILGQELHRDLRRSGRFVVVAGRKKRLPKQEMQAAVLRIVEDGMLPILGGVSVSSGGEVLL